MHVLWFSQQPHEVEPITALLRRLGLEVVWQQIADPREFEQALSEEWPDVVLLSYGESPLPAGEGLSLLGDRAPGVPGVVVVDELSDAVVIECLAAGACDCASVGSPASIALALFGAWQVRQVGRKTARRERESGGTEGWERLLLEHPLVAVALVDARGVIRYISEASLTVLGYRPDDVVGKSGLSFIHPEDLAEARRALGKSLRHPNLPVRVEFRARHRDGSWRFIEAVGINRLSEPAVGAIVVHYRDITEPKRAESVLASRVERLSLAARGANDGLWDWDLVRNTVYYSDRWKEMIGFTREEIGESPDEWFSRVHPDDLPHLRALLAAHFEGRTGRLEVEYRLCHRSGEYRWMLCRGLAARDSTGRALRMAGLQTDITDRKAAELELLEQATRDPLTGLANRAYFLTLLARAVERSRTSSGYRFALVFVDLDDFKKINDRFGHLIGDQCLIVVARRLASSVRPGDTVARLGGDEFTVLLDSVSDTGEASKVVGRIQEALSSPLEVGGYQLRTTASIGLALGEGQYRDAGDVLHAADRAMYRVKMGGGGGLELA